MFIVLGATGHVGSAVADALLTQRLPVTAVAHDADGAETWARRGARSFVVDVHDTAALRHIFQQGTRAFLLNPPADVRTDTDAEERATARSIVAALEGSGLEKVVLASTFGAQKGEGIGDLSILYEFEQAALDQSIPVTLQRGAYYFTNWDAQVAEAREGTLTTLFPPDLKLPMVAPSDLGRAAADRLVEPFGDTDLHLVEGPRRYSARDVALTFSDILERPVQVVSVPPDQWEPAYRKLGFSASAAKSYARMTKATIESDFPAVADTEPGSTTLEQHLRNVIAAV